MSRLSIVLAVLVGLGLTLLPAAAQAQGFLVVSHDEVIVPMPRPIIIWPPHPPHPPYPIPHPMPAPPPVTYKVKEVEVNAKLLDQVAKVQMSQTFENTGSRPIEATFVFPLPYDGAIDQLTLLVDGKEYAAKLLDAKEARKMYEDIVRKNRDPALLEWMGTGLFKTSVFPIPAGAKRTVTIRYSQLLRNQDGLTDFLFPLSTAKYSSHPVEKVEIRVSIESQDEIKNIYSPSHALEIKRPDDKHATVSYTSKNEVPTTDFRLFYDVGKGKVSTKVLSYRPEKEDEGFFMVLTSPQIKSQSEDRPKKTVLFVLDKSGSMSGKKIEQVRSALKDVLNKLRDGDLFNIVAYDSTVETFRPELQKFDEATRKAALGYVEGLYAGGSTNIEGALKTALGQLQDEKRPAYIVFLTDGLPTTGETNEMKIVKSAVDSNRVHARIFCFGVGYDVNSRLLDKLCRENFGQSGFVRPDEDIETHVAKLYGRIEAPVLTNVKIDFSLDAKAEEGKVVNRVYPKAPFDLFAGEQLVLVGRYKKGGTAKVVVSGTVNGQEQKFDFPAELIEKSKDDNNGFIEKLWAIRRIGEILDEIDLKGKNDELVKELVTLSTKHGILTPYTSFMADDSTSLRDVAGNVRRAGDRLDALAANEGAAGVAQRAMKGAYQQAAAPAMPGGGGFGGRGENKDKGSGQAHDLKRFAAEAGLAGPSAAAKPAMDLAREADKESAQVDRNVRNIGNRTFFRRDSQWVDSRVTKEQETNAKKIKQFSTEYFELANRHGRTMSQYFAFDEPVLLNIDNQAYLIEP